MTRRAKPKTKRIANVALELVKDRRVKAAPDYSSLRDAIDFATGGGCDHVRLNIVTDAVASRLGIKRGSAAHG